MFKSSYVPNEVVPSYDEAISAALSSHGIAGGGKPMKIAVENFDGNIYRIITSIGMGAYMHAITTLLDLGFKDTLADNLYGKDGYDSWCVTTPEMQKTFISEELVANDPASEIMNDLDALSTLPITERRSLTLSRIGQGEFRTQLISYWKVCAVTGTDCIPLLKASHIKPWRISNNRERLDLFNGLLLSPNLDAAFDTGFITFDDQGKIVLSDEVSGTPAFQLHINAKLRINQKLLRPEHQSYLAYHRKEVFRG